MGIPSSCRTTVFVCVFTSRRQQMHYAIAEPSCNSIMGCIAVLQRQNSTDLFFSILSKVHTKCHEIALLQYLIISARDKQQVHTFIAQGVGYRDVEAIISKVKNPCPNYNNAECNEHTKMVLSATCSTKS